MRNRTNLYVDASRVLSPEWGALDRMRAYINNKEGRMNQEEAYERMVVRLEADNATRIARLASKAVKAEEDDVYAADIVASVLLDELAWEHVEAADISDIAYEACQLMRESLKSRG